MEDEKMVKARVVVWLSLMVLLVQVSVRGGIGLIPFLSLTRRVENLVVAWGYGVLGCVTSSFRRGKPEIMLDLLQSASADPSLANVGVR